MTKLPPKNKVDYESIVPIIDQLNILFDSHEPAELIALKMNSDSGDYYGCSFNCQTKNIEFRVSKKTPKKVGQFVTLWKRDCCGKSLPMEATDPIDFFVVLSKSTHNLGFFIFPKSILIEKGILSTGNRQGKRGIRVYPSWEIPKNKQATKTYFWQQNYFVSIKR